MDRPVIDRHYYPLPWLKKEKAKLSFIRYQAVFFDLDGTIVETIPHICESYRYAYEKHHLPIQSDAEVMAGIGLPLRQIAEQTVPVHKHEDFLRDYRAYNESQMSQNTGIFWPAYHLLTDLKKLSIPMGLVTSKGLAAVRKNLQDFDLYHFFDIIVTSQNTDIHKPNPEPLFCAVQMLEEGLGRSFQVKDCLYVGDSRFDVESATKAGMPAALVRWTHMDLEPIHLAGDFFILQDIEDLM